MMFSSSFKWVASAIVTLFVLSPSTASAQWLKHLTPGVPQLNDGKPNLSAPAPRTPHGRPDLSSLWEASNRFATDFTPADAKPRDHRRDFGHIDLQTTVEVPKTFTRPGR